MRWENGEWPPGVDPRSLPVNARLGKCMATAKGTPVTSEITPMYSGVNVRAGCAACVRLAASPRAELSECYPPLRMRKAKNETSVT